MQKSAIILEPQASDFKRWAAAELQRYLRMLCGCEVPVLDAAPEGAFEQLILLGGSDAAPHFAGLKPEGFVLQTIDLHGKPAGLRTHALVSLGSAVAVVVVLSTVGAEANALSRVVQGLVTGVGFIGAGVILHRDADQRVVGLTTAASIWVAAALGIACGSGHWFIGAFALLLTLAVLVFGGDIEQTMERWLRPKQDKNPPDASV